MIFLLFPSEMLHLQFTTTHSLPFSHLPERPFEAKVSVSSATCPSLKLVSATPLRDIPNGELSFQVGETKRMKLVNEGNYIMCVSSLTKSRTRKRLCRKKKKKVLYETELSPIANILSKMYNLFSVEQSLICFVPPAYHVYLLNFVNHLHVAWKSSGIVLSISLSSGDALGRWGEKGFKFCLLKHIAAPYSK